MATQIRARDVATMAARLRQNPTDRAAWKLHPDVDRAQAGIAAARTEIRAMLSELAVLANISPQQVAAELRPLVADLAARRRNCDFCLRPYLRKRFRGRGRFCDDTCRNRWYSRQRSRQRKPA